MPSFYLDTSAVVKRYRREPGTEAVDQLLDSAPAQDRFFISFLVVLELTSGVLRLAKSGRIDDGLARQMLSRFRQDIGSQLRVWPLDESLAASTIPVIERHKLRSADALHLATALAIRTAIARPDMVLVSSDRELLDAAAAEGMITLNPQNADAVDRLTQLRGPRP